MATRSISITLASFALLAPAPATAQGAAVCISKKGGITVRAKCLGSEKSATLSDLTQKGPNGDTGGSGPQGAPGREVIYSFHGFVEMTDSVSFTQQCPDGKIVVGGGCFAHNDTVIVNQSFPREDTFQGWECKFRSRVLGVTSAASLASYAICIDG